MATVRALITQKLVNAYPLWSDIRNDEQSIGAQILNTIGLSLEDLHEQLVKQNYNNTIPFANVGDIGLIYKYFLPQTYEFDNSNNDQANPIYSPPIVVGTQGATNYTISLCDNNDIESFWYNSLPTRITVSSTSIANIVADTLAVNMYGCIASITQDQSPYIMNVTLDQPYTRLWVQTSGAQSYIRIDDKGLVQRASIVITGITRRDVIESETLIFLYDDVIPTRKEWKTITKLEIYNVDPSTVNIRLFAHRFQRNQTPLLSPPKDFYNLDSSVESKQDMDTFYDLDINTLSHSIIKFQTWQSDDIRIRMSGFVGLDTKRSFELRNTSNAAITTANDLTVEPFSNRIWIVDNTTLYLFDNEQTLPDMSVLLNKDSSAMSIMEPDNYHVTPSDTVTIDYQWHRQISEIVRHRVWVQYPDGTLHNAAANTFSAYDKTAWIYGTPTGRILRQQEKYILPSVGDYIFNMEVVYANGISEIDQRIVSVDIKKALAQFSFTSLAPGGLLKGIDFDSDQNMWILVNTSGTFTKLKVTFAYDTMMIDYQNKIIFFKEKYDQVRIT